MIHGSVATTRKVRHRDAIDATDMCPPTSQTADTIEFLDCQDTSHGVTDSFGDGCNYYNDHPYDCGMYEATSDFDSMTMCCKCGGGFTTGESNMDGTE